MSINQSLDGIAFEGVTASNHAGIQVVFHYQETAGVYCRSVPTSNSAATILGMLDLGQSQETCMDIMMTMVSAL